MPKRQSKRGLSANRRKANAQVRRELRWCRIKWSTFNEAIALWKIRGQDRGLPGLGDVLWFINRTLWDDARRKEHHKRLDRRRACRMHEDVFGWGARVVSGDFKHSRMSFIRKRRK